MTELLAHCVLQILKNPREKETENRSLAVRTFVLFFFFFFNKHSHKVCRGQLSNGIYKDEQHKQITFK